MSVGGAFALEPRLGGVALGYVIIMIAYSWVLKSIILLDVFAISAGFVLAVVAGAAALDVPISIWLYICTGLGALFIALSKRRTELAVAGELAAQQRRLLGSYSLGRLDQLTWVVGASALIAYSVIHAYPSNLPDNNTMLLTIPVRGLRSVRYLYLVRVRDRGENPEEVVITDLPMILTIVLWFCWRFDSGRLQRVRAGRALHPYFGVSFNDRRHMSPSGILRSRTFTARIDL